MISPAILAQSNQVDDNLKQKGIHILFLQSERDALGGVMNVNIALASGFLSKGYDVTFIHFRQRTKNAMKYPKEAIQILINDQDLWCVPRYSQAVDQFKHLHLFKAMRTIYDRKKYDQKLQQEYLKCQDLIHQNHPDIIICSHYECIQGIPEDYLMKTYLHYHNDFSQIKSHEKQLELLKKYTGRIRSFLWLSEGIQKEAQLHGLTPSTYKWNPVQFETEKASDVLNSRKVVFLGRFCPEKRVEKAMELFLKASEGLSDWQMDIYGIGELTDEAKAMIQNHEKLHFKGQTSKPMEVYLESAIMVMTSTFEGLPLTIIEANECGVPVILYDYGASAKDIVLSGKTGEVIPMDDENLFIQQLRNYMMNDEQREQIAQNCKQFAKNFHLDNILVQWEDMMKGDQHEA